MKKVVYFKQLWQILSEDERIIWEIQEKQNRLKKSYWIAEKLMELGKLSIDTLKKNLNFHRRSKRPLHEIFHKLDSCEDTLIFIEKSTKNRRQKYNIL